AFGVAHIHATGNARRLHIVADIERIDRSACRAQAHLLVDMVDAQRSGRGVRLHRTLDLVNRLRAGREIRIDFSVVRNFDLIRDGNVSQAVHVLADANRGATLFDRRIGEEVVDALLRAAETETGGVDFSVDVDFAVGSPDDLNVAGGIGEIDPYR